MQKALSIFKTLLLVVCLQLSATSLANAQNCTYSLLGYPNVGTTIWNFGILDNNQGCFTNATTIDWDFGDSSAHLIGGIGHISPFHIFHGPGVYQVCVTIAGNVSPTTLCMTVTIASPLPFTNLGGLVHAAGVCYNGPILVELFGLNSNEYQNYAMNGALDSCTFYFAIPNGVVANGSYVIRATPINSPAEGGYLPTYYGNQIYWSEATLISPSTGVDMWDLDIDFAPSQWGAIGTGNGTLSGTISGNGTVVQTSFQGNTLSTTFNAQQSRAILLNSANQPIGYALVNFDGTYSFPNLPVGEYSLRIENPKVNSPSIPVSITAAAPEAMVNVEANSNGISVVTSQSKPVKGNELNVAPNPAHHTLMLSGATGTISLINTQGKVVMEGEGSQLNIESLPDGLYTIKATNAARGMVTSRFIKN